MHGFLLCLNIRNQKNVTVAEKYHMKIFQLVYFCAVADDRKYISIHRAFSISVEMLKVQKKLLQNITKKPFKLSCRGKVNIDFKKK